jgi:diguanylate cyclase (GGDEF)-like protein/PAS domain S-box-containing protein
MPARPTVFADRTFQVVTALSVVNVVAFFVQENAGRLWPSPVNWLLMIAVVIPTLMLCRRVQSDPASAAAVRRYWHSVEFGILLFVVVAVLRGLADLGARWLLPVAVVLHLVGGLVLTWPLIGLPFSARSGARKVGVWLDLGTLSAAAGLLIWHFAASAQFADGRVTVPRVLAAAVIMGAGLNLVYLAAKVVIAGVDSFARRGLYWIGGSALIGGFGSAISFLHPAQPQGNLLVLVLPLAAYAAAVGARVQVVDTAAADRRVRTPRGYSLMPYVGVAAVDATVIYDNVGNAGRGILIDVVAVTLTALVLIRQLIAFRQNDALLARIGVQEQRFRLLVQNSTDMVTITEPGGTLTYVSPAAEGLLGAPPDDLIGTDLTRRMHPDDLATVTERLAAVAAAPGNSATYPVRLRHADGTYRWLEVISVNLTGEPSVGGIVSNARDTTETREVQDRLSYEASHDVLTGLANRTLFGERVAAAVTAAGQDTPVSIVLIDLDDFKVVNDTLGHATGDALLVHVAKQMQANVRAGDTVARLGGDEFAILFEGAAGSDVDVTLHRIAAAMLEPALVGGEPMTVRASFGVVDGRGGDDSGDLLRQADIAMYEAKGRGEGGYQRYQPGMEARGAERSRKAAALRTALLEEQLAVFYQPVVTLPDGRITGCEALVRWQHPTDGLLGPGAFIDAAEQSGLIVPLGTWVLRAATREAATWPGELKVSVNVSARQLRETGFPSVVAASLRDSGLPAHRLTVEITESVAVGGGATTENLQGLRELGVRLSLDDFGTGASTLTLLATCPVDQIKLDRSFVPDGGSDAIADAVVQMARAFGLEAVAEGVETAEQVDRLTRLGYERAQGFHFARPMSAADLHTRLDSVPV